MTGDQDDRLLHDIRLYQDVRLGDTETFEAIVVGPPPASWVGSSARAVPVGGIYQMAIVLNN